MRYIFASMILFLFLVSCDKGKKNNDEDVQIPYIGDSAYLFVSSSTNGEMEFNIREIRVDSFCLYFRYVGETNIGVSWNNICKKLDSFEVKGKWGSIQFDSVAPGSIRSLRLDYYAIAWIDGEPYRSKDQFTYGGYEKHFNDDTLYQYDSTRPLVFPDSMECNQAIALFLTWNVNNKKDYWTDGVKCLGLVDRACLPYEGNKEIDPSSCVIEFEGNYNDAATQLERNAPSAFITLYPWCEGLKRCGGGQPPI